MSHIYKCIMYIYIEREREREKERQTDRQTDSDRVAVIPMVIGLYDRVGSKEKILFLKKIR